MKIFIMFFIVSLSSFYVGKYEGKREFAIELRDNITQDNGTMGDALMDCSLKLYNENKKNSK